MTTPIQVVQWGLGAMGSGMARLLRQKDGIEIVAAFDRDANKIGQDLGAFLGGEKNGVLIQAPPLTEADGPEAGRPAGKWPQRADLVLLATSSFTREVAPQIKEALRQGLNVISIAEEMAYPYAREEGLAREIDQEAGSRGVSVLGTGINPGFVLDTLVLALTGPCLEVKKIKATRINDLSPFGPTVMRTQGVGTTVDEFAAGLASGAIVGHVGFRESIHLIAKALGWRLERIEEQRSPIVAKVRRETPYVKVEPGQVAGCRHTAVGYVGGEAKIELIHPQQVLPQVEGAETGDYIEISGKPSLNLMIKPEIPGGLGTMAMAVNMIPQVLAARPGLLSMAELPLPSALLGDVREILKWRKGE
ncbi:4-hydroxy-tetrahydrodipicolinate reductase [Acididesulfobacillus acetoxydans]|uniref:4-hydroxy-tetrahydrodipicolinate reductase n=1 Tax=Acididesulfobacillus acetoxydans TaxID=1561005 RepID=A0A8S0WLU3_9FIRM|nr:2,4-diaminopentanoate dehydrogenase [Acididesulfobacillus acetoxydans]CAA7600194.1 4-hydroxy-tetrahydrodipicolinate reductase [Acididesulfobacillus acetoxydans]CEJ09572.1 Dihydrodipicolinate reductase [Acididesulfobacillus acetoxydans]